MQPYYRSVLLFVCLCLMTSGCSDGRPPVYPASGKMLYNGEPMPLGASVTFLPMSGTGVATSGTVDEQGNLSVSTFGGQEGLVEGEYRVIVYQITDKEPDQVDADGEIRAKPTDKFTVLDKDQKIPKIYSDRNNSPLSVTIKAGDNDLGTIDLKADAS